MRRARTSLPTPGSPRISKGAFGSARRPIATRSRILAVFKTVGIPSVSNPPWTSPYPPPCVVMGIPLRTVQQGWRVGDF